MGAGVRRVCAVCHEPIEQPPGSGRWRTTCSNRCRQKSYRKRNRRLRTTREVFGSSRSDDWATPAALFAHLDERFGPFDLDPCATAESAKCERYFTRSDDGLAQEWTGRVFMNPPYGPPIGAWVRKAWESAQNGCEVVVCLVPARTDTRWWHEWAMRGEIEFLRGRLSFGEGKNSAPFPSAVVTFRNASDRYEKATS